MHWIVITVIAVIVLWPRPQIKVVLADGTQCHEVVRK